MNHITVAFALLAMVPNYQNYDVWVGHRENYVRGLAIRSRAAGILAHDRILTGRPA